MFLEQGEGRFGSVVQLPFIDERAPAAMTAVQLDNAPSSVRAQRMRLLKGNIKASTVDGALVERRWAQTVLRGRRGAYPRGAHDWERFKVRDIHFRGSMFSDTRPHIYTYPHLTSWNEGMIATMHQ
jgi:hypothetical protein